jgi:predicted ATP-grasp superfamily ATP-dependent carboligase
LIVPDLAPGEDDGKGSDDPLAFRPIADIPAPGSSFDPGDPVMTILARGINPVDCRSRLNQLEREWTRRLEILDGATSSGEC